MHAGLSNNGKSALVSLFNDAQSSLKVLILLVDVGANGLNMHVACDEVIIGSIPPSKQIEGQIGGRALRVSFSIPE